MVLWFLVIKMYEFASRNVLYRCLLINAQMTTYARFYLCIEFIINRNESNGGNLSFKSYADLEKYFAEEKLHPADLKASVETYINKLLDPVRKIFSEENMKKLVKNAYPTATKKQGDHFLYDNIPNETKKKEYLELL